MLNGLEPEEAFVCCIVAALCHSVAAASQRYSESAGAYPCSHSSAPGVFPCDIKCKHVCCKLLQHIAVVFCWGFFVGGGGGGLRLTGELFTLR